MNENGKSALRIALTLFLDLLLIGAGLCLFALFHHVLPQRFESEELYAPEDLEHLEGTLPQFDFPLPGNDKNATTSDKDSNTDTDSGIVSDDVSSETSDMASGDTSEVSPDPITPETLFALTQSYKRYENTDFEHRTATPQYAYIGSSAMVAVSCHTFGEGNDKVTYYAADIFLSSATALKAYVCTDSNGNVSDGDIAEAAKDASAVFMVNTDYFKSRSWGYYIRNGVKYLTANTQNDICILYLDGTMEVIHGGSLNLDMEKAKERGIWQIFTFGPSLFSQEGIPYTESSQMNITSTYNLSQNNTSIYGFQSPNPRTAIGYVEPGHYVLVTVDGRQTGYSRGATLPELAAILFEEGANLAYNLDGGGSAQMYFGGDFVNLPASGRSPSDYLYIPMEEGAVLWNTESGED